MNLFSFTVDNKAEDHVSLEMAQKMFDESGRDGRSGEELRAAPLLSGCTELYRTHTDHVSRVSGSEIL